jgi:spore coat polysaccharide biosynthesis protein SpsF
MLTTQNRTIRVAIGIQARSTSTRLPNKVAAVVGTKPIIHHVVDACVEISERLNNRPAIACKTFVLCPQGDPVQKMVRPPAHVIEGPEHDVLTRYAILMDREVPDYLVRITADTPIIPPFVILSHINAAVRRETDYLSNTLEESRTAPDGWDCEVISLRLMQWLQTNAVEPQDREHVTFLVRRHRPEWARVAHVIGFMDQSHIKISVDTEEDLNAVRRQYAAIQAKIGAAEAKGDIIIRL